MREKEEEREGRRKGWRRRGRTGGTEEGGGDWREGEGEQQLPNMYPPLAAMAKPHPHSVHLPSTDLTLEWSHVETTVEGSVVEDQCSRGRCRFRGEEASEVHKVKVTGEGGHKGGERVRM